MKVLLAGKYGSEGMKSGPICFARSYYEELCTKDISFVLNEFFSRDYANTSLFKRLFGKERVFASDNVYRIGLFRLIYEFITGSYDIVHILNNQRFVLPILLLKPFTGKKIIYSCHGLVKKEIKITPKNFLTKSIYALNDFIACGLADALVYPSELLMKAFNNCYRINGLQKVIPLAPDKVFSESHSDNKPVDKLNYMFYADADDEMDRGSQFIINMFNEAQLSKSHLYVITGKYRTNAAPANITFVKPMIKTDLVSFLMDKHFVVKAATFDSFSIFTAECMTAGLIPLVSDKTGISEHIINGKNGFVYSSDEPESLFSLMKDFENGVYNIRELSEAASKSAAELSWSITVEKYISLYKELK